MLYFAYGSNMCRQRLEARIGACGVAVSAYLDGYRLCFQKRGKDGSGKCDFSLSAELTSRLYGVVYELELAQINQLDAFEGAGYRRVELQLNTIEGPLLACAYQGVDEWLEPGLKPYAWYKALVLQGAREHDLPDTQVEQILKAESMADPDLERSARNRMLLEPLWAGLPI